MLWNQLNYVIQKKLFYISFYIEIKKRIIPPLLRRCGNSEWKSPMETTEKFRQNKRFNVFCTPRPTFNSFVPNLLRFLYHTIHIFIKGILWVFLCNLIDNILKSNGIQPDCVKKSQYLFYKTSIYITIQCK